MNYWEVLVSNNNIRVIVKQETRYVDCSTGACYDLFLWFQVVPAPSRFGPGRSGPKLKVVSAPFEIKYF
jgi:hypothetical protein